MSLARYLVSHTVRRWKEQPWSPLARGAVAALVTGFAVVSLAGFDAAEKALDERLEKSGVNTVVLLSPISPGEPPSAGTLYSSLRNEGALLFFVRLHLPGETAAGERYAVYAYTDDAIPEFTGLSPSSSGGLLFDPGAPEGLMTELRLADRAIPVRVNHGALLGRIPADGAAGVALVPFSSVADIVADGGGMEVVLFERAPRARPLTHIVASVERMNTADRRRVTVISAASLMDQIATLRSKKTVVMGILTVGLVAVIALVFGALAALEYRENRFVLALLRSMGATRPALAAQSLGEALVVAFASGGAMLSILPALLRLLALHLNVMEIADTLPAAMLSASVVLPLTLALLLGSLLATIPAALGLRTPFGTVLE